MKAFNGITKKRRFYFTLPILTENISQKQCCVQIIINHLTLRDKWHIVLIEYLNILNLSLHVIDTEKKLFHDLLKILKQML